MNKFKSLLLLCLGFAFMAFPMGNQGFCNGDPIAIETFAPCTADIAVSQVCNPNGSATVTITVSNSTGDDATASVSGSVNGTYTTSPAALGMANGDFTVTIPAPTAGEMLTISVNVSSSTMACDGATIAFTGNPYAVNDCAPMGCQNCFSGNADIEDANGFPMEGGEVCGDATELFEVGQELNSDGTIGSMVARDVTFEFGTSANLVAGFEVFVGSEFLCTNAPISCATLAEDNTTSFTAPAANVQVKIAPNPVTNIARISYDLPQEGTAQVSVFDLKGNQIAVIASGYQASGVHTVDFDASNLAGGFYYLTVQTANTQVTERMVIVK